MKNSRPAYLIRIMPAEGLAINKVSTIRPRGWFFLLEKMSNSKAFIFANGELDNPLYFLPLIQQGDFLIAVDGGIKHLLSMNLTPNLAIGDFDSLTQDESLYIENNRVQKISLNREKNETDLEIAIQTIVRMGYTDITLLGVLGGRLDHTLENLLILSKSIWKNVSFKILDHTQEIFLIRNEIKFLSGLDEIVSLIPLSVKVSGVKTDGLKYKLIDEDLFRQNARGISNYSISNQVSIKIKSGILLCFHIFNKEMRLL